MRKLSLLAMPLLMVAASPAAQAQLVAPAQCPTLRWVTLGTAGGPVPTADRSEPANLLLADRQMILVDTGDGTVGQLARVGMTLAPIASVFISHPHMDHTGGLAAVIGLRWMNQFPGVLTVYGPRGTKAIVDGIVASMATQAKVGFGLGAAAQSPADAVRVVELADGQVVMLDGLKVTVAVNSHFDHPGASAADAPQSLSLRFALGDRAITFTGDTGPSAAVTRLAAGSDMLISEVIALDQILDAIRVSRPDMPASVREQMQHHLSTHHLQPGDLGKLAADANVGHLVLTHFAIPPGPLAQSEPELRVGVATAYTGPVDVARDLSSFDVGCRSH